ncbi:DUF721 domain-containing protein [Fretibacterium sp. OH1220_COT-178]|uniref:DUF721 domain-containing protein n=1 Tax=Fretibacterium sp. OH1220_COT-178 TaxID=2491047 RepID=UPI000F5DF753|nr:DUF721 domain-containing protein [Fretibacterium sp. OH1220_COT-178]RRD63706.1 DUF721 domain-containing protein [Fretibacterium sp. OH1220_COT-178]
MREDAARNAIRAGCRRLERVASLKELLEGMVPGQSDRIRRLEDLMRNWAAVVGPGRARLSAPYELEDGELRVAAATPHAAQQIGNMKGNILRALRERWGLEADRVRVTQGPPPLRRRVAQDGPRRRHPRVVLPPEEVEALRSACPEALSDEAALGLARLRAFFARRFPHSR